MATSEFIAYFDESGDHGLDNIDLDYPVFVLCGCVFRITHYLEHDLPAFSKIKFDHFDHDAVILHSRAIRKRLGVFQALRDRQKCEKFMADVAAFFTNSKCTLIAAAIDKIAHKQRYRSPYDPYSMSLLFCLERLYAYLRDVGATNLPLTCVFEQRGEAEDKRIAAEFTTICGGANSWGPLPFHAVFANKQTNMAGLQMADLAAYPIGRYVMDRSAPNAAYDAIGPRFRTSWDGRVMGFGLKIFP
jgi:hypothetical protein